MIKNLIYRFDKFLSDSSHWFLVIGSFLGVVFLAIWAWIAGPSHWPKFEVGQVYYAVDSSSGNKACPLVTVPGKGKNALAPLEVFAAPDWSLSRSAKAVQFCDLGTYTFLDYLKTDNNWAIIRWLDLADQTHLGYVWAKYAWIYSVRKED